MAQSTAGWQLTPTTITVLAWEVHADSSVGPSQGCTFSCVTPIITAEDPEAMFRETNMTFDGLKSSFERACIIEYLHSLKSHKLKV